MRLQASRQMALACSSAATQLLPVLRSESMQNFLIFGFTVLRTCRVSPASACAAHSQALWCITPIKAVLTLEPSEAGHMTQSMTAEHARLPRLESIVLGTCRVVSANACAAYPCCVAQASHLAAPGSTVYQQRHDWCINAELPALWLHCDKHLPHLPCPSCPAISLLSQILQQSCAAERVALFRRNLNAIHGREMVCIFMSAFTIIK